MIAASPKSAPHKRRRETSQLTYEQCSLIERAFVRANTLDLPLNTHVTIHWGLAPSDVHPVDRWQRFYETANAWLKRRLVGFTWVYVWECGVQKHHGRVLHMHLAIHLPSDLVSEFRKKASDWVRASTNPGQYQNNAVDVQWIWTATPDGLMRYILKGANQKARSDFKVPERHSSNQGKVQGKRSEVSRNLRDISWRGYNSTKAPFKGVSIRSVGPEVRGLRGG